MFCVLGGYLKCLNTYHDLSQAIQIIHAGTVKGVKIHIKQLVFQHTPSRYKITFHSQKDNIFKGKSSRYDCKEGVI